MSWLDRDWIPWIVVIFGIIGLRALIANAQPAISYSDYKNSNAGTDITTMTISSVQVVGTNTGLAVCVYETASTSISSVVFNTSENLSFVVESVDGDRDVEWWYLSNPTATTADVVVTLTGAGGSAVIMGTAVGLSNVAQAQPALSSSASCDACTVETVDLTATVNQTMLLACAKHNNHNVTATHGAGQTELSDFAEPGSGGERKTSSYKLKDPSGLETLEVVFTGSGVVRMVAIGIEPVPVTPGVTRRRAPSRTFR